MKSVQPYFKLIEKMSLPIMLLSFVCFYLFITFIFGCIYYFNGVVVSDSGSTASYIECIYFSFITTSTIGYGDFRPYSWGRLLVILQAMTGLLIFSVGTALVVLKVLTPHKDAILFEDIFIFTPRMKRFTVRLVNRLPTTLSMAPFEMRLHYKYVNPVGRKRAVRKTIIPLRNTVSILYPLRPLLMWTRPFENVSKNDNFNPGKEIILEPIHINPERKIVVHISAKYFLGEIVCSKEYSYNQIHCGEHLELYEEPGVPNSKMFWGNWNKYEPVEKKICASCINFQFCNLQEKQLIVEKKSQETSTCSCHCSCSGAQKSRAR